VRLPYFGYYEPATLEEALALMAEHREKLRVLAGGTELFPLMKFGLAQPSHLVSSGNLPGLRGISVEAGALRIGAMTTLAELSASGEIRRMFNAVYEAAESVAAPPVRNVATLAGNLCQNSRCLFYNQSETWRKEKPPCFKAGGGVCLAVPGGKKCFSVYQGDLAPAIAAFGGTVKVEKKGSSRTISIAELFSGDAQNPIALSDDEMITAVLLPLPEGRVGSAYMKMRMRSAMDYPLLSVAAVVFVNDKGTIDAARVVVGAAGPAPSIAHEAIALLLGQDARKVDLDKVGQAAARGAIMVDNLVLPASYRKKMIAVFARRAVEGAIEQAIDKGIHIAPGEERP
jgi:4-hydroxybenzoyl-CoA reductase subunit beta